MKIIAHRGANKIAPQNTISAFRLARQMPIDGFETDVHLTRDGRVVLCHNPNIDATSNGTGYINFMSFDELRSYDFGSYFSKEFEGEKIPELSEFLSLAAGLEIINIEIKTPFDHNYAIVDETLRIVAEHGLMKSLLISSFDPIVLRRAKDLNATVKTGLLYDFTGDLYKKIRKNPVLFAQNLGCNAIHPLHLITNRDMVDHAHQAGMTVNVWTVNDTRSAKKLQKIQVDSLITNVPDTLSAFGNVRKSPLILQESL